jgi:uncharacterized protein involved in response to NO
MFFFAGMCQLLLTMAWWSIVLGAPATGLRSLGPPIVPPPWAHQFLMLFTVFPFFIFGFLFTVYPRWMHTPPVVRAPYIGAFSLLGGGTLLLYLGLLTHRNIVFAAVVLVIAGWGVALSVLMGVYRNAKVKDSQARLLNLLLLAGLGAMAAYLLGLITRDPNYIMFTREAGLWLFLIPVVFSVAYRMIPFFSASVLANYKMLRPPWALPLMLVCVVGHAGLEFFGLLPWRLVFDLPLLFTAVYLSVRWQFRRSFQVRLLAMLHIAFLWLTVALALYNIQSAVLLINGGLILGQAPLHALTVGFVASMAVAMVSRVTLGHSGRALMADNLTWYAFLGISMAAVVRIAAALPLGSASSLLNLVAALLWLISLGSWVARYALIYWQPRVDGKPG